MLVAEEGGAVPLALRGRALLDHCLLATQTSNASLLAQGIAPALEDPRSVCVLQGECAARVPSDWIVGSQDATSCVIVALWCSEQRVGFVAHVDSSTDNDKKCFKDWVASARDPHLYLVGGFPDEGGLGEQSAVHVLEGFHALETSVRLRLCVLDSINVHSETGAPLRLTLALETRSGRAFSPLKFSRRGPKVARRMSWDVLRENRRPSGRLLEIFKGERYCLPGFNKDDLQAMGPSLLQVMEKSLRAARKDPVAYRLHCSTTPLYEPPWFVEDMIARYEYIIELLSGKFEEDETEDGRPLEYRLAEDRWVLLESGM